MGEAGNRNLPRLVIASLLFFSLSAAREPGAGWNIFRSPHFELLTSADPALAEAALAHLEAVRVQLADAEPWLAGPAARTRILAFSSEKEFELYRSSSQSPAYFASGPEGDLIVLGRLAKEHWPTLAHEYVHAAIRASGVKLPLWLEEGLAELYSGRPAARRGKNPRIGPPELLALENRPVPAEHLRSAGSSAGFYRQSRLMAHLLRHHPGYAPRWSNLLLTASAGNVFAHVQLLSGRSQRQIATDATRFTAPFPAAPAPLSSRIDRLTLPESELRWTLAVALARLGRARQALEHLDGIDTAPAHALAAKLLLRQNRDAAAPHLRRAFELGTTDEYAIWQLVCLEQDHPSSSRLLPALERLIHLNPQRDDARMILASHYLSRGQFEQARRHLHDVRSVPGEFAAYYERALRIIGPA